MNLVSYDVIWRYTILNQFSLLNAILFSSIFSFIFWIFCRKTSWMIRLGLQPLILFGFLCIIRLLVPLEMPFRKIVNSWRILPGIRRLFRLSVFQFQGLEISIGGIGGLIWIVGVAVLILRLGWQWGCYIKRIPQYPEVSTEMMVDLKNWIPEFRGTVRMAEVDTVPCMYGLFRPIIFLPATDYTLENLRLIFLHEWQHFCNRDQWIKLICHLLCCVFWWNPFLWLLKKKLDQLLELRCDYSVLKSLSREEQVNYYTMLLNAYQVAWGKKHLPEGVPALASAHSHDVVLQRFQVGNGVIFKEKSDKKAGMFFSVILLVFFCLSYLVIFQPFSESGLEEDDGVYTTLPETSYLTPNEDGTYTCHIGEQSGIVQDITVEPFISMPIIE